MADVAQKLLQNALKSVYKHPVEGFAVEIPDDSNIFVWTIFIEGPADTPYEGGIFEAKMEFPSDYPMSPPSLQFISEFWHPNVYENGKVCISILHPPGEDAMSGELPEERWLPTQTVSTILLSVISILNDPNISSPANVDASVQWRKDRENYNKKCRALAKKANARLPHPVTIPHPDTNPVERQKQIDIIKEENGMGDIEIWDDDESDGLEDYSDDDDMDFDEDFDEEGGEANEENEADVNELIAEESEEASELKSDSSEKLQSNDINVDNNGKEEIDVEPSAVKSNELSTKTSDVNLHENASTNSNDIVKTETEKNSESSADVADEQDIAVEEAKPTESETSSPVSGSASTTTKKKKKKKCIIM